MCVSREIASGHSLESIRCDDFVWARGRSLRSVGVISKIERVADASIVSAVGSASLAVVKSDR